MSRRIFLSGGGIGRDLGKGICMGMAACMERDGMVSAYRSWTNDLSSHALLPMATARGMVHVLWPYFLWNMYEGLYWRMGAWVHGCMAHGVPAEQVDHDLAWQAADTAPVLCWVWAGCHFTSAASTEDVLELSADLPPMTRGCGRRCLNFYGPGLRGLCKQLFEQLSKQLVIKPRSPPS